MALRRRIGPRARKPRTRFARSFAGPATTLIARDSKARPDVWFAPSRNGTRATARILATISSAPSKKLPDTTRSWCCATSASNPIVSTTMAPIIGRVHIGYLPRNRVVGISKLARLVDVYARRLQIQEKMTAEIASCLDSVLNPFGVAVVVEAAHECMTTRGVHKSDVTMVTSRMLGVFRDQTETRQEFLSAINLRGSAYGGNAGA